MDQFPVTENSRMRNSRVLGFDYGHVRIGVAVGNGATGTAEALTTVRSKNTVPDWQQLDQLIREWKASRLVVGLPLSMAGEETAMSAQARKFGRSLAERSGLEVDFVDERLSSVAADQLIQEITPERKKIRKKHTRQRDNIAAQLILQTYFGDN